MDTKQIEYIIKIAEEKNITRAAKKLYITQSALNQQLIKLEKQLGIQLFYRSRGRCYLTEAGKIYVENAKKILRIKKDTYNQIHDLIGFHQKQLVIGLTPERGTRMFAAIYPEFYQHYPDVKVIPLEMSVREQQKAISEGKLDIGFLTLQEDQMTKDEYIHLCDEPIVLAVPGNHPLAPKGGSLGELLPVIRLNLLQNDSFAIMQQGSTLREICDSLFTATSFSPDILIETRSCYNLYKMVEEGICCSIFPISYARNTDRVAYFSLSQKTTWKICASYRKNSYLRKAARQFIALAGDYWQQEMQKFSRIRDTG